MLRELRFWSEYRPEASLFRFRHLTVPPGRSRANLMSYYLLNADTDRLRITEVDFTQGSIYDFQYLNVRIQDSPLTMAQDLAPTPGTMNASYLVVCPYGKYPDLNN